MRKALLITTFLLSAGLAHAQVVSPLGGSTTTPASPPPVAQSAPATAAPSGTTSSRASRPHMTAQERFDEANTTHDGKLTREQAHAAHMYSVARNFDKIDTAKHGYITFDELKAYRAKTRAERRAARQSQTRPAAVAPQSTPPSQ